MTKHINAKTFEIYFNRKLLICFESYCLIDIHLGGIERATSKIDQYNYLLLLDMSAVFDYVDRDKRLHEHGKVLGGEILYPTSILVNNTKVRVKTQFSLFFILRAAFLMIIFTIPRVKLFHTITDIPL